MESLFLKYLDISIQGSVMLLPILILRAVFRRAPRRFFLVLWASLGARLLLPFSFQTEIGVLSEPKQAVRQAALSPALNSAAQTGGSKPEHIAAAIWAAGTAAMLLYMLAGFFLLKRKTRESVPDGSGALLCDRIASPFVLGIIDPKIYLPADIPPEHKGYVVMHERSHIARRDNIWKPLGFLALCLHWFNPLVWLGFWLFERDMEIACDQRTVRQFDTEEKKRYTLALLHCSAKSRAVSAYPVAFGEISVKQRIKLTLSARKAPLIITVLVLLFTAALTVFFFTVPKAAERKTQPDNKEAPPQTTLATLSTEPSTQPSATLPPETSAATQPAPSPEPAVPQTSEAQAETEQQEEHYEENGNGKEYDDYRQEDGGYEDNGGDAYEDNGAPDNLVPITPFEPNYEDSLNLYRSTLLEVERANRLHEADQSDNNNEKTVWDPHMQ